jgi:hypothetical protein
VLPLRLEASAPVPDPQLPAGFPTPPYLIRPGMPANLAKPHPVQKEPT